MILHENIIMIVSEFWGYYPCLEITSIDLINIVNFIDDNRVIYYDIRYLLIKLNATAKIAT